MIKIEHDVQTGEITELEMTAVEMKEINERIAKDQKRFDAVQTELKQVATAKTALLDRLGLTAEEARLLLA